MKTPHHKIHQNQSEMIFEVKVLTVCKSSLKLIISFSSLFVFTICYKLCLKFLMIKSRLPHKTHIFVIKTSSKILFSYSKLIIKNKRIKIEHISPLWIILISNFVHCIQFILLDILNICLASTPFPPPTSLSASAMIPNKHDTPSTPIT